MVTKKIFTKKIIFFLFFSLLSHNIYSFSFWGLFSSVGFMSSTLLRLPKQIWVFIAGDVEEMLAESDKKIDRKMSQKREELKEYFKAETEKILNPIKQDLDNLVLQVQKHREELIELQDHVEQEIFSAKSFHLEALEDLNIIKQKLEKSEDLYKISFANLTSLMDKKAARIHTLLESQIRQKTNDIQSIEEAIKQEFSMFQHAIDKQKSVLHQLTQQISEEKKIDGITERRLEEHFNKISVLDSRARGQAKKIASITKRFKEQSKLQEQSGQRNRLQESNINQSRNNMTAIIGKLKEQKLLVFAEPSQSNPGCSASVKLDYLNKEVELT